MDNEKSKKAWSTIKNILTIIGAIGGVVAIIQILGVTQITLPPIVLVIFILFITVAIIIRFLKKKIIFFSDRNNAPKRFKVESILKKIARKKLNLTVAGRTNKSWFEDKDKKKELYENALKNDCKIKFIIQHDYVKNVNINDDLKIQKIEKERKEAISSFKYIYEYLENKKFPNLEEDFQLRLTQEPVNNSITDMYRGNYHTRFTFDIGLNLKQNPFLVFCKNSALNELLNQLSEIERKSMKLSDYEEKYRKANIKIEDAISRYSQFSEQRENHNKKLIHHYYKRKGLLEKNEFYPPISIQLLITNKCTAKCIMCRHHSINSKNELSLHEIENILDYINDIGTKNIIISGGEPLYREDCIQILEKAKKKNMNIGLLTNGIKYNGEGFSSLSPEDAQKIKETCSWIQISIDSFDSETYKKIRNVDIDFVKQSLNELEIAGANLEIAFTIQKLNIDEAINIIKKGKTAFKTSAKIRFKFAHGPNNRNDFLLKSKEAELLQFLKNCEKNNKFNTSYISEMFEQNYFTEKDIIEGTPLRSKNITFKENKYTCHVLNYSCKIDAEGDLYPCCFLYDDNMGNNSKIRNRYKLGTLRTGHQVISLKGNNNILKELLSKKVGSYSKDVIPLEVEACNYCTRHFYQNAFLNEIDKITLDNKDINFIYSDTETLDDKLWI